MYEEVFKTDVNIIPRRHSVVRGLAIAYGSSNKTGNARSHVAVEVGVSCFQHMRIRSAFSFHQRRMNDRTAADEGVEKARNCTATRDLDNARVGELLAAPEK